MCVLGFDYFVEKFRQRYGVFPRAPCENTDTGNCGQWPAKLLRVTASAFHCKIIFAGLL